MADYKSHRLLAPASKLKKDLQLDNHFEGGYFRQTDAVQDGDNIQATQIYYLIDQESPRGRMHMNLHSTFHTHHQGRALYTLIRPPTDSTSRPEIKHVVMGSDLEAGEVLQLFVPGGWWKASEVPVEDLEEKDEEARSRIGCLISEVVVPGWTPEQHQFIDLEKLKDMWHGENGWEDYEKYIQAPK